MPGAGLRTVGVTALLVACFAYLAASASWAQAPPVAEPAVAEPAVAGPPVAGAPSADPSAPSPSHSPVAAPSPSHSPVADTTAGRAEPLPDELEGIGITEHLDSRLPLDLEFTDDTGKTVRLRDYFDGRRPVVLNLAYYTCPMLCTLVLNGVVEAMNASGFTQGEEFLNVIVSIDPSETASLAAAKKENYLKLYRKPVTGNDWHFLVGQQAAISSLAEAVGFGYRYDEEQDQYIHTAATFILTPDGRVSRYLYGIEVPAQTFRLGLLEAADGKIGNTVDRIILYCFHYDAASGRYAPLALNIVRLGGGVTLAAVVILILALRLGDSRRRRSPAPTGAQS